MTKRTIEIFIAGCPLCDRAVKLVESILCPSCELEVLDLSTDPEAQARAQHYGVNRVPAVAVDGKLAECCRGEGVDVEVLRALGVGRPDA
jgi:glutaredoxin